MADGKWMRGLKAKMPVETAARLVLETRLHVVSRSVPKALFAADRDSEHVHQLRVGTRRAGAALRIFAKCLPGKRRKKIRKRLQSIRRAAGEARDWDVYLEEVAQRAAAAPVRHQPGLDFLLGYGYCQRALAQAQLADSLRTQHADFKTLVREASAQVRAPGGGSKRFGEWALPLLSQLLADLEAATRRKFDDYDNLHRVRIAGKRLRYAMEIFAPCFESAFREEFYAEVERMQEILGLANDSHVARQRLETIRKHVQATRPKLWRRLKPGIEALIRFHAQRLSRQRRLFAAWWKKWRRLEPKLAALLDSKPNKRDRRVYRAGKAGGGGIPEGGMPEGGIPEDGKPPPGNAGGGMPPGVMTGGPPGTVIGGIDGPLTMGAPCGIHTPPDTGILGSETIRPGLK